MTWTTPYCDWATSTAPGRTPSERRAWSAIFSRAMLEGRPVVINGSGEQERDFLHVSDVAEASVRALETGSGKAFNIGTGRGSSVNHIFSLLKEITGYPLEAGYGPAKPGEVFKIYLDITGARQGLGWQPGFSLEDGLRNTVAWFGEASRE